MVSCLMGDSTALASAIVRCCPKITQISYLLFWHCETLFSLSRKKHLKNILRCRNAGITEMDSNRVGGVA